MPGFDPQEESTSIRDSFAMRQLGTTVSPKDIDKALKPYRLKDAKVKGKSDDELYNMAQTAVVKWWQRQQKSKIVDRDPGKENTAAENQALKRMNQKVEKSLNRIPDVNMRAERRAQENRQEARRRMDDILRGTGLRNVDPPAYAMESVKTLRAWVNRQVARRNQLRRAREDYLR